MFYMASSTESQANGMSQSKRNLQFPSNCSRAEGPEAIVMGPFSNMRARPSRPTPGSANFTTLNIPGRLDENEAQDRVEKAQGKENR
ncbi:hypothetical protein Ddc_11328 [Ditylenchus destructor]|nr:hypothetical protein Ddc_11328 [Ditylenchus destructor]